MPITGSQKALTYSFSGIMRAGASRSGWFQAIAALNIAGATITDAIKPSAVITDELDAVPNTATVSVRGGPSYVAEVLADAPSGYWKLDEMAGATIAVDRSGNGNNGSYSGPTLSQTGAISDGSKAASFDGSNDYVSMGDVSSLGFAGTDFTIECWVKFTVDQTNKGIVTKSDGTSLHGWLLTQLAGTGKLRFIVTNSAGTALYDQNTGSFAGSAAYNDGNWHHVVVTYTKTAVKFYVDGTQLDSRAPTSANWIDTNPAKPVLIGARGDPTAATYFQGFVDEVAVYATALSSTRVSAHYAARLYTSTLLQPGNEIIIGLGNLTNRIFAGHILKLRQPAHHFRDQKKPTHILDCIDYSWQLDWKRVSGKSWTSTAIATIVGDILSAFAPAFTVRAGVGLPSTDFQSNHDERVSEALSRLMKMAGGNWYVDYDRIVHVYVTAEADANAVSLDSTNTKFWDFEYAEDASQIRTRTRVTGGSTTTTAVAAVGATSLAVDDTRLFATSGGYALVGGNQITYTGKSTSEGPGNLTGIPGSSTGSILYAIAQGESVRVLGIQSSATAAALVVGQIGTGDGYLEHSIEDGQLGDSAANTAASGDVSLNSGFDKQISYKTRDIFTRSGKVITVDLTNAKTSQRIQGTFKVQRVVISDIEISRTKYPIRSVEAGSNRQDLFTVLGDVLE